MNLYSAALENMELAFSCGYPLELQYKLYERSARCYIHLEEFSRAQAQAKAGQKALTQATGLDESRIAKIKTNLEMLLTTCSNHCASHFSSTKFSGQKLDNVYGRCFG